MNAWDDVRLELDKLVKLLDQPAEPRRLYAFADGFARLAKAYHAALKADGKSSVRMRVVEKALDLKTAKSELTRFVSDPDADER